MDDIKRTEFGLIDRSDDTSPLPGVVTVEHSDLADHNEAQKVLLSIRSVIDRLAEKPVKALFFLAVEPEGKEGDDDAVTTIVTGNAQSLIDYIGMASVQILDDLVAFEEQNDA